MSTNEKADPGGGPAGNSQKLACSIALTRGEFIHDCIGRILTLGVSLAASIGSDTATDRLLRLKDRHNRKGRP